MPAEVQEARKNCVGRQIPDFVTTEGREFRKVKIGRAGDTGLSFAHHTGVCVVSYELLPENLQKEFLGFSFPPMSPAVKRCQAILHQEITTRHLGERVASLKGTQTRRTFTLARDQEDHDASLAESRALISARIERFEAQRKQLQKELAEFDSPEAVAARRKEMEAVHSKQKSSGRPIVEPDPAIFDKRRKSYLEKSVPLLTSELRRAKDSLNALEANAKSKRNSFAREAREIAAEAKTAAPVIARAEKKLAEARTVLAKQIKESAEQNDDPAAFDRYCEEHKYPRPRSADAFSR